ncbi:MAG: hypothetical protein R6V32_06090 [Bacteroidales bacterium]
MNKHILYDLLAVSTGAFITGKNKYFAKSIESPGFQELLPLIDLTMPDDMSEGSYEPDATSPDGDIDPAFRVEKWLGGDFPTIIYHHGNNERPFDYRKTAKNSFLNVIAKEKDQFNANLINVRAPFHNDSLKAYQHKIVYLHKFMTMVATSVKLIELIRAHINTLGDAPVMVSGISLGGFVTNLHRTYYNSADFYVPLLAGAYMGELFLQSKYKKLTSAKALQSPDKIRHLLNFDGDYKTHTEANVFPLLARHDQYVEYDVQKLSYNGNTVHTIDAGHVTGALKFNVLREHLLSVLDTADE